MPARAPAVIVGLGGQERMPHSRILASISLVALLAAWLPRPATHASEFDALENAPGVQLIAAVDAMHAGDLVKAEALFTLAIDKRQLAPEGMAHAYYNRGLVRQRQGMLKKAVSDYNIAISSGLLSPQGEVDALYNRGLAWRKLGNLQEALDDFTRALEINPRFPHAYYSRALGLAAKGHYILALADFDKALKHGYPQAHKPWYGKALVHLARGERQGARAALLKALKLAPRFKPARERLAMLDSLGKGRTQRRVAGIVPLGSIGGMQHAAAAPREEKVELAPLRAPSRATRSFATASTRNGKPARNDTGSEVGARKRQDRIASLLARLPQVPTVGDARDAIVSAPAAGMITGMAVPETRARHLARSATPLRTASVAPIARHMKTRETKTRKAGAKGQARAVLAGAWAIQLASESSEKAAWRSWRRLRATVMRQMPRARARVMKATIRGRGTRYRLRLVGFASRDMATAHCRRLKTHGISCYALKLR